ncbi:Tat pathway signal protein [Intrasporangium oryzae NRRL B-24470]|uniref:Tat pathway signal protein n=1 Tax=Intrasporangium oryzae NRRL B-24470 TaxID=1386089 RepID=W9GE74_9MICO|nr:N-acetylmuramoyl-L-alanine amidase [Intrasporangium oryzae]EWT02174.1 Tat pathway signal protein [Intrasporangium oryzae NRRL B-24470]
MTFTRRHLARFVARFVAVTAGLAAALTLGVAPQSAAVTSPRTLNDTRPVSDGPVGAAFPIEYFGVVADLAPGAVLAGTGRSPYGEARFRVGGAWTAWQPIEQDGAQSAGQFTGALITVDHADAYQVRGLPALGRNWRAAAINTTDGRARVVAKRPADAAYAAPSCRSRADWGADESISGWSKGTDTQAFYPAQVLTVHHSAGSNDPNQDYSATVRAIYSYHVQTNGWSDIGYQYLVDGHGVVYEGRNAGHTSTSCLYAGGDGADFAHETTTDRIVNGAHVGNYNAGNIGIALLGCYEPTSECSGDTTPSAAAVDGLDGLLAALSTRHHLDPQGTVHYVNPITGVTKDVATISGHRDWLATACPGATLYAALPTIRADVAARMGGTPPPPPSPATITSATCTRGTCTFTGTGVAPLRWTFGNGAKATGSQVSTTYKKPGTYTVTLTDSQSPPTQATRAVSCSTVQRKLQCTT